MARNYKKDPSSRKNVEYIQKKLSLLEEQWSEFESTDSEIRSTYQSRLDHDYFAKAYYDAVLKIYSEFRKELLTKLTLLEQEDQSPSSNDNRKKHLEEDGATGGAIPKAKQRTVSAMETERSAVSHINDGSKLPLTTRHQLLPPNVASSPENSSVGNTIQALIRRQQCLVETLRRVLSNIEQTDGRQSKQFYEVKIKTVEKYWNEIENIHYSICEQVEEPSTFGYTIEEHFTLEETTQTTLIRLYENQNSIAPPTLQLPTLHSSNEVSVAMKLPKVSLPRFDGTYLKWRQFHDLFQQMVHSQSIGNAQKMWYLKSNLTGEAERLVSHLPPSDANYTAAWNVLKARYENKRLLVGAHLDKLLSQPNLSVESAAALKTLHDTTNECLLGLQNLEIDVKMWDPLLLHILTKKLDNATRNLYEQGLEAPKEIQTVSKFLNFLELRFQSLEALGNQRRITVNEKTGNKIQKWNSAVFMTTDKDAHCKVCNGKHKLFMCSKFLKLSPEQRLKKTRSLHACTNCLKTGHNASQCPSRGCLKCNARHNTLLHIPALDDNKSKDMKTPKPIASVSKVSEYQGTDDHPTNLAAHHTRDQGEKYVFLATALLYVQDIDGNLVRCRAILDSGSQINLITEHLSKLLKFDTTRAFLQISGLGNAKINATQRVSINMSSRVNDYSTRIETHIIKEISNQQPQQFFDISTWAIPKNVRLADPEFFKPQRIDMLIGAALFCDLLSVGQIKLGEGLPTLQNSLLGWIILGKTSKKRNTAPTCGITNADLDNQLQRFWLQEEIPHSVAHTLAEQKCEKIFKDTTERNNSGRFIVRLPFSQNPQALGQSKDIALRRFLSLEKRLSNHPQLRDQYSQFMREYTELHHMQEVKTLNENHYFMPHHCVLRPSSSTTKLRVVFDASAKTSSNVSLNDIMLVGPKIQDDLFCIILRFRTHKYVFAADIAKMYRQILVAPEDRQWQMILWRYTPEEPIKYYQLNTVTYGTASAPYLAVKCLQQLAETGKEKYPLATQAIKDFYVDDILTGSDNLEEAIEKQKQLRELLRTGGFELRKWCANHPELLTHIPKEDIESKLEFGVESDSPIKTLGLAWQPYSDIFSISTTIQDSKRITKRSVLADIAHVFDPLGLINPVVVYGKIFMQRLWLLKIDWDEALPQELDTQWKFFRQDIKNLDRIKFPRLILPFPTTSKIQLHAFSDASEKAYGAALYIRVISINGNISSRLLCAKSKAAPTKKITLPRLELCAAKLTAQLVDRVKLAIGLKIDEVILWTDSTIVLSWIATDSSCFHTFVANRIAAIHRSTHPKQWRHIDSKQNPADLVSRGTTCTELLNSALWFEGPKFLKSPEIDWPSKEFSPCSENMEKRKLTHTMTMAITPSILDSINHRNSFTRLQRIVAYVLRFKRNTRNTREYRKVSPNLQADEIFDSLITIMKEVQGKEFLEELTDLKKHQSVKSSSKLSNLLPFLDEFDLVRVGGRLQNTTLPIDARHPILLPQSHWVTRLLMEHLHKRNMHAGPQALLAITRERFWPLNGLRLAQSVVHKCIICTRARPKLFSQIMGTLPLERVQPARAFTNVGIDFCGPLLTHYKIRGKQPTKSYIALFVCFSTKACHLEVVSDLTTAAFIGSLKRFIARRGRPSKIFSDNATNFIGARNELKELFNFISSDQTQSSIQQLCSEEHIQWCPIPPRSPHFGGLWEAAVKSAKHHLKRTLLGASLTFEEISTIVAEVEAILNSRPLTPLSSKSDDLYALTPGHFLIGEPLTTLPNPYAAENKGGLLTRWNLVSKLQQEFWRKWSKEYLQQLQIRHKWTTEGEKIKIGMMVLLKEDNLPPLKWSMGRIIKTYKGNDNRIRVVVVKTATGTFKRAIHTLSPLPIETEELPTQNQSKSKGNTFLSATVTQPRRSRKRKFTPINSNWLLTPESLEPRKKQGSKVSSDITNESNCCITRPFTLGTLMLTTLFLCWTTPASSAPLNEYVNITSFPSNPGIYFEGVGQTSIVTDQWNLIVYYDITNYWKEINLLKKSVAKLKGLCRPLTEYSPYCMATSNLFSTQLITIETTNNILQEAHTTSKRSKRSPLNIIGNIAHALFGVLDEEYAQNMAEIVSKINSNEKHLLELTKNQTSLINSTLNIIEKGTEYINNQLSLANNYIDQIWEELRITGRNISELKLLTTFNSIAIHTTLSLNQYQGIQTALTDVLTDAHKGKINPLLLTPKQLQEELRVIRENLPSSLSVPGQSERVGLRKLYSLMQVTSEVLDDCIVFSIKIPLTNKDKFDIYKVIPIPIYVNSTIHRIRAASDFLALSLHRDLYYQMSEEEFSDCTFISHGNYLCQKKHSIFSKNAGSSQCEIQLLHNHKPNLPANCIIQRTDDSAMWTRLANPNDWIFAIDQKHFLLIVCGTETFQTMLEGAGLLHFKKNCVFKHDSFVISAHHDKTHEIRSSLIPNLQLNMSELEDHIATQPAIHPDRHPLQIRNNKRELEELRTKLVELQSQESLREITSTPVAHKITGYGSFVLSCIIITYIIFKVIQKHRITTSTRATQENIELPNLTYDHVNAGEDV